MVTAQKMNDDPVKKLLDQIYASAQKICEVAKTANKNGKSLNADGFYGNKFHELTVQLAGVRAKRLSIIVFGRDCRRPNPGVRRPVGEIEVTESQSYRPIRLFEADSIFGSHGFETRVRCPSYASYPKGRTRFADGCCKGNAQLH